MSKIITSSSLTHQGVGFSTSNTYVQDAYESSLGFFSGVLPSGEQVLNVGAVVTPSAVSIKNIIGADVLIGFASGVYTQRVKATQDILLRLEVESLRHTTKFTFEDADQADYVGAYWDFTPKTGKVVRVWMGNQPGAVNQMLPPAVNVQLLTVVLSGSESAPTIASLVSAALNADGYFVSWSIPDTGELYVADRHTGVGVAVTTGTTGATTLAMHTTVLPGGPSPTLYLLSDGTSNITTIVTPN